MIVGQEEVIQLKIKYKIPYNIISMWSGISTPTVLDYFNRKTINIAKHDAIKKAVREIVEAIKTIDFIIDYLSAFNSLDELYKEFEAKTLKVLKKKMLKKLSEQK